MGALALAAHMADYAVTLRASPDLVNFFCFAFPLQSLFVAYVTLLNTLVDDSL